MKNFTRLVGCAMTLSGLLISLLSVEGCSLAKVATGEVNVAEHTTNRPTPVKDPAVIYVRDFDLDYEHVHSSGILQRQGISRRLPAALKGDDPQQKAQKIVHKMTESLMTAFTAKGITTHQLNAGVPLPAEGWLVHGEFIEVDEGNRAVRATIGFGAGATAMDVSVFVSDLSGRPDEPFMIFGTTKTAGKMPGAVVTMNPFVAAGKFVMEKNASEKDVKKTAEQIAAQIIQQGGLTSAKAP